MRTGEKEQEIIQITGAVNQMGGREGTPPPPPGWPADRGEGSTGLMGAC